MDRLVLVQRHVPDLAKEAHDVGLRAEVAEAERLHANDPNGIDVTGRAMRFPVTLDLPCKTVEISASFLCCSYSAVCMSV